jgi:hypothetical protein
MKIEVYFNADILCIIGCKTTILRKSCMIRGIYPKYTTFISDGMAFATDVKD